MIVSYAQNSPSGLIYEKFSQILGTFVLFSQGCSFHLCCFGNLSTLKFAICILKSRLGGEMCLFDFIMHKGYCITSQKVFILLQDAISL